MLECPVDSVVKAKRKKMPDKVGETDRARERNCACVCVFVCLRERGGIKRNILILKWNKDKGKRKYQRHNVRERECGTNRLKDTERMNRKTHIRTDR
jgi:hypothetical protein